MTNKKILAFEYIQFKLLAWYKETGRPQENNDFSILKSLKLLFFVVAARTNSNSKSILLEDVFSNFVAMPYGHVESDIYNSLRNNAEQFEYFEIDNQRTLEKNPAITPQICTQIESDIKTEIDLSIKFLRNQNPSLILLSPFDLVSLSHSWYSWQFFFNHAKKNMLRSVSIPIQIIKEEDKIFSV